MTTLFQNNLPKQLCFTYKTNNVSIIGASMDNINQVSIQDRTEDNLRQLTQREREHYYRKNSVQNGKSERYTTIATNQICFQNKKSTNQRQKKRNSKTSEVQQGSQTAPIVDRVNNSTNQQSSVWLTTTHHVTTCDHSQNSPTNKPVSIENQDMSTWFFLRVFF